MISVGPDGWAAGCLMRRKLERCDFVRHCQCNVSCMVLLHIELCLFISLSVTLMIFQGYKECPTVLTENFMFSSD